MNAVTDVPSAERLPGSEASRDLRYYYRISGGNEPWHSAPVSQRDEIISIHSPRYVTFLATTVTDDPASRIDAQYLGPLVIDIDRKDEQGGKAAAIQDVQRMAKKLEPLGVSLDQVLWFASGQKGFHILFPTALFMFGELSEIERRHLPAIYKGMVYTVELYTDGNDMSLYAAGKGKMLRQANVEREEGRYKVPLTAAEVLSMTPVLYDTLTAAPREINSVESPVFNSKLGVLFANASKAAIKSAAQRRKSKVLTAKDVQDLPDNKLVIEVVKCEALRRILDILPEWLPGGEWQGDHYVVRNPKRNDRNPGSFMIWIDGGFKDWACPDECSGGDLVALYAYLNGWGNQMEEAARKLASDLDLNIDAECANLRQETLKPATVAAMTESRDLVATAKPAPSKVSHGPALANIQHLLAKQFPPVKWVVQDLLPAGVTLFAAAPKVGKSWLAMDVAVCVAAGVPTLGGKQTTRGWVLYLGLEDNERRLQKRFAAVMTARGVTPDAIDYATAWDRIGLGGTAYIEDWLKKHEGAALVVVDTLARIKPDLKANKDRYAQEYAAMSELKALSDRYPVSILVITHTRKQAGDDPMDSISGSNGQSGGVDNTWIMKKARGEQQAALFVIGRDIEAEVNYGLQWDPDRCVWSIEGTAAEVLARSGQQEVLTAFRNSSAPMSVQDVASTVGKERSSIQRALIALVEAGMIKRTKAGRGFAYSRT